jgi:hypothetical protein
MKECEKKDENDRMCKRCTFGFYKTNLSLSFLNSFAYTPLIITNIVEDGKIMEKGISRISCLYGKENKKQ